MIRQLKKIALINPRRPLQNENIQMYEMYKRNRDTLRPWFVPPLNLLTIASHTPSDIEIIIIDEHFEQINFEQKFDLVGITAMTQQAVRAYEIADEFRRRNIPVVMGGIHATILPDEALQHVDTVFVGEAEEIWEMYLEDFKNENEKSVYKRETQFDLSASKIPRFDLINFEEIKSDSFYMKYVPIYVTRGCPHACNFCVVSKVYGRNVRKKTVSQVVKEIEYLQRFNKDLLIMFADDNFFVDRKFTKTLLKELIPLKINYLVQSDIKIADDPELLKLAYLSGCQFVFIGFETVDIESLSEINQNKWKMMQLENYEQSIKIIQENGLVVFGAFILGFQNDDLITFQKIKEFVINNNILAQFTLLTPLPGSILHDQLKSEGKLYSESFWDNCSFFNLTFKHDNLTKEIAEKALVSLYDEVFKMENALNRTLHMKNLYKKLPPRWVLTN